MYGHLKFDVPAYTLTWYILSPQSILEDSFVLSYIGRLVFQKHRILYFASPLFNLVHFLSLFTNFAFFLGFKDSVTCVGFSPDGGMVAMADLSGVIRVFKIETKKEVWSFECSDTEVCKITTF